MADQTVGKSQAFAYSHPSDSDFAEGGLRPYARYRDLGLAKATQRAAVAHVIRFIPPCTDDVRQWHTHDIEFQMVYVLKGWIEFEYEGQGRVRLEAGSCVHQPPGIRHRELGHSDDVEMLEIVLPANFATEEVASVDD